MGIIEFSVPTISGIAVAVKWIVDLCGTVWLGVVVFTLVLKLITLPFDYASRASMRKNSVKMEQMRPELEKLQRQYADNKDLYNQKMMALYKKNGYSMFGSCLPTILTLVMFIVAINGFTAYSKYQNQTYFYNMTTSYNNVVYAGFEVSDLTKDYIYTADNGEIKVNIENIKNAGEDTDGDGIFTIICGEGEQQIVINYTDNGSVFTLYTDNGYTKYNLDYSGQNSKPTYEIIEKNLTNTKMACENNNNLTVIIDGKAYNYAQAKELSSEWTKEKFITDIRQEMSAKTYRAEQQSFIWVKNIWATDSTTAHPIESDYNKFKQTHGYEGKDLNEDYNALIAKLDYEKTAPNGYFILIALTALSSLVMQLVMGKAQKAQMELQTVDGQGAQTQKVMQWMMPIMMAFFAFMYTAAFSIYIILSSLFSMLTTFLINFIVDLQLKKEQDKKPTDKVYSKVYVPKEQPKEEQPKKKKVNKDDKFAHESGGDFLTGKKK